MKYIMRKKGTPSQILQCTISEKDPIQDKLARIKPCLTLLQHLENLPFYNPNIQELAVGAKAKNSKPKRSRRFGSAF